MLTDQELTAALHDYADRNAPDTAAVRAAIEHGIASGHSGSPDASIGSGGPGRRRPLVLLAVAACTLALVGLGLVITRARQSSPQQPGPSAATPSLPPLGIGTLPGTRLVGTFAGTGPRTVPLPTYAVPAGFDLQALFVCRGAGAVRFYADPAGSSAIPLGCQTESDLPGISSRQRTLHVVVGASTRWRIDLVVTPKTLTNGSVQSPPGTALDKPTASGRGTASFQEPAQFSDRVSVELTCVGTGVSLTSANHRFDGNYTHTCFAGHSYTFRISRAGLPTTVTVHADANTTWRLVIHDY